MKTVVIISAALASSLNFFFISSWHLGFPSLLQLPPSTWPVPYPAVLCLFLSGIGIFSFFRSFRFPLTQLLGLSILLVGLHKMTAILGFKVGFPIDSSGLTLAASVGFMLIGTALLFWKRTQGSLINSISLLTISSMIIFIGAVGMFATLLTFNDFNHLIHFYSAFGFFLIGLGFIFSQFHLNLRKTPPVQKWPLFIKKDRK